mgnify:CR=1 FL=1
MDTIKQLKYYIEICVDESNPSISGLIRRLLRDVIRVLQLIGGLANLGNHVILRNAKMSINIFKGMSYEIKY